MRPSRCLFAFILLGVHSFSAAQTCEVTEPVFPDRLFPQVRIETSLGDIVIELDRRRAPITVNNFLRYLDEDRYDGTVFHRVVADFVVQGGGYGADFSAIETFPSVYNESGNGLINKKRSVAMARHEDPHSATSQFFFNLADNENLDPSRSNWGYTVFGSVLEGWEIVEQIAGVETGFSDVLSTTDVPIEPVTIRDVVLLPSAY